MQHMTQISPALSGSPEVRQKTGWNLDETTLFVGPPTTCNFEINPSGLKIHLRPAKRKDRFFAPASVKTQENETGLSTWFVTAAMRKKNELSLLSFCWLLWC
jgi:hypothetical protein